jgi:pimeloyl-ACP methyl ester carboxylesterase
MVGFVAPLVDDGFRVVAVDLPAHGRSAGGLSSIVHFSEAMHIAAHVHEPVYGVITHSLGGAGLVRAFLNGFSARRAVLISPQAELGGYWRAFQKSLGMSEEVWAAMVLRSERWLGIRFAEIHPRVGAPKMTVPALILHGQTDRMSPVSEGRELARLWPGARIDEFAETGHLSILRDEGAICAAKSFMTG